MLEFSVVLEEDEIWIKSRTGSVWDMGVKKVRYWEGSELLAHQG